MTRRHLPPGIHLETLKDDAKSLLRSVKAGEPDALKRVEPYFDHPSGLQQIQLVIAREFGFESWTKLKSHIELYEEMQLARTKANHLQQRLRDADKTGRERHVSWESARQATLPDHEDSARVLHCSFCGKSQEKVAKLIAGPSVFICDDCVRLCVKILGDAAPAPA